MIRWKKLERISSDEATETNAHAGATLRVRTGWVNLSQSISRASPGIRLFEFFVKIFLIREQK